MSINSVKLIFFYRKETQIRLNIFTCVYLCLQQRLSDGFCDAHNVFKRVFFTTMLGLNCIIFLQISRPFHFSGWSRLSPGAGVI